MANAYTKPELDAARSQLLGLMNTYLHTVALEYRQAIEASQWWLADEIAQGRVQAFLVVPDDG